MFERHWHEILDSEHPLFSLNFYTSGPPAFSTAFHYCFSVVNSNFFSGFYKKNGFLKALPAAQPMETIL